MEKEEKKKKRTQTPKHVAFIARLEILRNKREREAYHIKPNEKYFEDLGLSDLLEKELLVEKDIADLIKAPGENKGQKVNAWYNSYYFPRRDSLALLAKAFNVSVEWILSENDTITPELEKEYIAFKKYGISEPAYRSLVEMKEQGVDMDKLMVGLNHIISFQMDVYKTVDDGIDTKYLPILEALSDFFTLYEEGLGIEYDAAKMQDMMNSLSEEKGCLTTEDYEKVLDESSYIANPFEMDKKHLDNVKTYLELCRGKMVKKTLERISNIAQADENEFSDNGYKHSQKAALKRLNVIYNGNF